MSIYSDTEGVEYVTVESSVGSVRGKIDISYPNVAQFLGIPFAEAPLGPLRWLPPLPKVASDVIIDATVPGLSCPQWNSNRPSIYNSDVTEYSIRDETSEDCLNLSIWAPVHAVRDASIKLPVIVWITGGAFLVGGSTIPYQNPIEWVQRSQRHIVVSINYRLSIFGFPNASGLSSEVQNLGLLDQRAGLEWVHKYIATFGGDPARLTHFGQSAGALSVDVHSLQYIERPLVRSLILHSGTALQPIPGSPRGEHFSFVAKGLGFVGDDAQDELEFMRKQKANDIISFMKKHFYSSVAPYLSFRPVVDEVTLFSDCDERAKAGKFSRLPCIIGTTNDEGNSLVAYDPDGVDTVQSEAITKGFFLEPAIAMSKARSKYSPTFRYLLKDFAPLGTSTFPNIAPRPWQRAYHSSDLPLIFGTHNWFRGKSTLLEETISFAWQDLYVAFAEDGAEGLRALGWNSIDEGEMVVFGCDGQGWKSVSLADIDSQ